MKRIKLVGPALAASLLASCASSPTNPPPHSASTITYTTVMAPKQLLEAALHELIDQRDISAVDRYWAQDYIQHNPRMPDGSEIIKQMTRQAPSFDAKTARVIADGDLVVVHNRVTGMGPQPIVGYEIFRIADGKLAEHWDVQQPEARDTVSGHTQLDGPTEIADLDKTAENKALVKRFFADVLYGHEVAKLPSYISTEQYVQHNPGVGDGLGGFQKAMAELAKAGMTMEYKQTYRYIAEGNFVFTHSEGVFAGKHVAFADLFRIANGKIVEHWDAIQEVPAGEAMNNHGVF